MEDEVAVGNQSSSLIAHRPHRLPSWSLAPSRTALTGRVCWPLTDTGTCACEPSTDSGPAQIPAPRESALHYHATGFDRGARPRLGARCALLGQARSLGCFGVVFAGPSEQPASLAHRWISRPHNDTHDAFAGTRGCGLLLVCFRCADPGPRTSPFT